MKKEDREGDAIGDGRNTCTQCLGGVQHGGPLARKKVINYSLYHFVSFCHYAIKDKAVNLPGSRWPGSKSRDDERRS